jgi:hypothetical protein
LPTTPHATTAQGFPVVALLVSFQKGRATASPGCGANCEGGRLAAARAGVKLSIKLGVTLDMPAPDRQKPVA